ncbi:VOC family protein [Microbacterium sp. M3]|jgi:predicted enzyme related to lactoylglutathione lyase|uniref:VOC family protein n=1 Tax=Microbacterium arthrosphaerae TaxID=792652 RepID=A0ABU4H5Y6_9MICO|nr:MULTISPECIES: VOC family protein [Microbacterium]MDW4574085.1 VOC family protein [Microbacterium arthrosphaerae]MDW7607940.1 VOC family protein [Microbacterium sp. M3]
MFTPDRSFSSFAVPDIREAAVFYRDTLGLDVTVYEEMGGGLTIALPGGGTVFVYPKEDHEPAVFTVLHFNVPDVEAAVDDLNSRGVVTKIYTDPDYGTDEKGIARDFEGGPDIAWFTDPAGNVIAVGRMEPLMMGE